MSNQARKQQPDTLSPEKLKEIIRKHVESSLDWEEAYRINSPIDPFKHDERLEDLEEVLLFHKEIAGEGTHYQEYRKRAELYLKEAGIDADPKSEGFKRLCWMLANADVKTGEVALKWHMGDWSATDRNRVLTELGMSDDQNTATAPAPPAEPEKPGLTLGQLVDAFWKERSLAWKPRTKTEYSTCRARILNEIGADFPVHSIDYYVAKRCRDKILKSGLSRSRVNLYIGFLSAVLAFEMQTTRILPANPCDRLKFRDTRRKDELRGFFDLDDLKRMFIDSPEYGQDRLRNPERFWVPLIALYTGARMEEICQLHDDQIAEVDGYWCIIIEAKYPDQSIKTSEKRMVPLSPFLLDLGLHRFAREKAGSGHLWPRLPRLNNRYGHYFGRWFKTFKDNCGIDPRPNFKVFHSFRHTVETKLQYEEVEQRYIDQALGHSVAAESARYGKRFMEKLYENAIVKLDWHKKLDFSHLLNSRWTRR